MSPSNYPLPNSVLSLADELNIWEYKRFLFLVNLTSCQWEHTDTKRVQEIIYPKQLPTKNPCTILFHGQDVT